MKKKVCDIKKKKNGHPNKNMRWYKNEKKKKMPESQKKYVSLIEIKKNSPGQIQYTTTITHTLNAMANLWFVRHPGGRYSSG